MKSRTFFSDRMKTTVREQLWIPAFLMLGFLLAFPAALLMKLGNWQELNYTSEQLMTLYENLWRDGLVLLGTLIAAGAAVMNAFEGFFYLYSGKKVDFYHGLPVKRSEMFLEKILTGLSVYLIPYVIMEFLAICIGAAKGFFSLKLMAMAVQMFLLHLLIYLLLYFMIVLVLCITGNLLTGMFCMGVVFLYGYALDSLLINYAYCFFETYTNSGERYGVFEFLASYGTPEAFIITLIRTYATGNSAKLIIVMLVLIVVLAVLSYQAYSRRPSESAGKSMVYPWVAVVLKYIIIIPFALGIGWIFYPLVPGRVKLLWWIFGLLLGIVIGHGIIEVLYHMSFHGFFAKKMQLVIAGIAVAVCAWCYQVDVLHFDDYLPKQDAIASVNVQLGTFHYGFNSSYVDKLDDGEQYAITEGYEWNLPAMALDDGDGIGDKTYQALHDIVAGSSSYVEENDYSKYNVGMKYTLKSGREIYRNYIVDSDLLKPLMQSLYEEENLKEKQYSFCKLDSSYLTGVSLVDVEGDYYSIFQSDSQKQEELLEALQKDITAASTEELMTESVIQIGLNYELPSVVSVDNMIPGDSDRYLSYAYWYFGIPASFENTLAILKETGYPLSVDEINISKIRLVCYRDSEDEQSEEIVYEDKNEIEELQSALTFDVNGRVYTDEKVYPLITVYVESDHTSGEEMTMDLLIERTPKFVTDKLGEFGIS